jgi:hypothetical protein
MDIHLPSFGSKFIYQATLGYDKKRTTLKKAVEKNSDSMLMAYFKLNASDDNAKKYTYYHLPEHYAYNHKTRSWHPRLQGNAISRIYTVHSQDGERYMLGVLLMHVTGARSFEELRTYQGRTYTSFWAAAQARGLLKDDAVWINCLEEAEKLQHPRHLRYLFAMILICCAPSDPKRLWSLFSNSLSADFLRKAKKSCLYSASDEQAGIDAKFNTLHHLNTLLLDMESSLDRYPTLKPISSTCRWTIIATKSEHTINQQPWSMRNSQPIWRNLQKNKKQSLTSSRQLYLTKQKRDYFFLMGQAEQEKYFSTTPS